MTEATPVVLVVPAPEVNGLLMGVVMSATDAVL